MSVLSTWAKTEKYAAVLVPVSILTVLTDVIALEVLKMKPEARKIVSVRNH